MSDRGPNIQYPIGQSPLFQSRLGGGGSGFGFLDQRLRRAGRKPGLDPVTDPELAGLQQAGPGGEIYDPESFFGTRFLRGSNPSTRGYDLGFDQLQPSLKTTMEGSGYGGTFSTAERMRDIAKTARNYRGGMIGQRLGGSSGFGVGGSDTTSLLKKILGTATNFGRGGF